jgi:2-octaprenyl-6-methoxyphenol hydroxylase
MQHDYDLIIAGGGLAGNCLALALKGTNLKVAVIEANTREQLENSPAGDRALALATGSVKMLENMGIWQGVSSSATAIKQIHVSDRGHFGKVRLFANRENVEALGYVITAREIETHLANLVNEANIELISPARVAGLMSSHNEVAISLKQREQATMITAKLLVGADGGQSSIRRLLDIKQEITDYGQTALVTTVKSTLANNNTAYERFTSSGPLAFLPVGPYHSAVVWTKKTEDADALMAGNDDDFITELQASFGYRLGELSMAAPKRAFPLTLVRAEKMVSGRAVIVGNAAHQLHPVAGQGFNLGLRDVMQLAEMVIEQHQAGKDIGAADMFISYVKKRYKDHDRTILFTDNVVRIFSNDWLAFAVARNFGLTLMDQFPAVKALLARHAMGLAERLPSPGNN